MAIQTEPVVTQVRAEVDEASFNRAVKYARDTGKQIDDALLLQYEVNVAKLQTDLANVKSRIKQAKKEGDSDLQFNLQLQANDLQRQLTEAKRGLNNLLNTGDPALSRLEAKFRRVIEAIREGNGILGTLAKGLGKLGVPQKQIENFATGIGGVSSSLAGFGFGIVGVAGGLATLQEAFSFSIEKAKSFEQAFVGVIKTTNKTEKELEGLKQGLLELSKTTVPLSFEELAKISELGAQLGVASDDLLSFTDTIARIGVSTNITTEEAATSLARLSNVFGLPNSEASRLGSTIVALGNNFATTESDIIQFSRYLGPAGKQAGLTAEQVLGIGAALSSVGISAEAGGSAFSKALNDINVAVATGNKDLVGFSQVAGLSAKQFSDLWRKDAGQAFSLFVGGLSKSGDQATTIIDSLIGTDIRLRNALLASANAGDILSRSLTLAGQSYQENNALLNESTLFFGTAQAESKRLNNALAEQAAILGEKLIPVANFFKEALLGIVNIGVSLVDNIGAVIGGVGALASGIGLATGGVTAFGTAIAFATGPIGIIIGAITALTAAYYSNLFGVRERVGGVNITDFERFQEGISSVEVQIKQLNQTFSEGKISVDEYNTKLGELTEKYVELKTQATETLIEQKALEENIKDLQDARDEENAKLQQQIEKYVELRKEYGDNNSAMQNLKFRLDQTRDSLGQKELALLNAQQELEAFKKTTRSAEEIQKEFDTQIQTGNKNLNSLNTAQSQEQFGKLQNEALKTIDAYIGVLQAQSKLEGKVREFAQGGLKQLTQFGKQFGVDIPQIDVKKLVPLSQTEKQLQELQKIRDQTLAKTFQTPVSSLGGGGATKRSGGGGGGSQKNSEIDRINAQADAEIKALSKTEEAKRANAEKILAIDAQRDAKIREAQGKTTDFIIQEAQKIKEAQEKNLQSVQKTTTDIIGSVGSFIDQTKKKIEGFDQSITDTTQKIGDVNAQLAQRFLSIQDEIAKKREELASEGDLGKQAQLQEQINKLVQEQQLAQTQVTEEEIAKQKALLEQTETEKLILKKQALEQELLDLQTQKSKELEILTTAQQQKIELEKAFTSALAVEVSKRQALFDALISKSLQLQSVQLSGFTPSTSTTVNNTFNVSDPTSAESVSRAIVNSIS